MGIVPVLFVRDKSDFVNRPIGNAVVTFGFIFRFRVAAKELGDVVELGAIGASRWVSHSAWV